MARLYQIGIVGATSLLGKELGAALAVRRFPALDPVLWEGAGDAADGDDARLVAFGDEPALLRRFDPDALSGIDLVFLAAPPLDAGLMAPALRARGIPFVDLRGIWPGVDDAEPIWVGLEPGSELDEAAAFGMPDAAVIMHPTAQLLAHLITRLATAAPIAAAHATVFEPASERGWPGIRELEQQSTRLLALQPIPQEVFDAQVAFNLRAELGAEAQPSLAAIRDAIAGQVRLEFERGGVAAASPGDPQAGLVPPLALELLQAPVFHGGAISLGVRFQAPPTSRQIATALDSPYLHLSQEMPDLLAAAGEEAMQLGPPRPDAQVPGAWWFFATLDNLRRTALSGVDAGLALLRLRERMA